MSTPGLKQVWEGVKFASVVASSKAIGLVDKELGKRYLVETLAGIPGMTAKTSQLLSMKLGVEQVNKPTKPQLNLEEVKAIIRGESPILFEDIDEISEDAEAASIGQVHRAKLKNGDDIAIKVQYPHIEEDIKSQINLLFKAASAGGPAKLYGLDIDSYDEYFSEAFEKETNYLIEADFQKSLKERIPDDIPVVIPKIYMEYSTRKLLVQSYESSVPLSLVRQFWPLKEKQKCARVLTHSLFYMIFKLGQIQTDFHPGNFGFRVSSTDSSSVELVLYDYGSHMQLSGNDRKLLVSLAHSYRCDEDIDLFNYFCSLGFEPEKLSHIAHLLPAVCSKIFSPLALDGGVNLNDWNLDKHFENILGVDKWWFRTAGAPWFLMMMRTVQGWGHAMRSLDCICPISWIYRDLPLSETDRNPEVRDFAQYLSHENKNVSLKSGCAKFLNVLVKEGDKEIVSLKLPAKAVDELENILPDTAREKIVAEYDLDELKTSVQKKGYVAMDVFKIESGTRHYHVWLS